MGETAAADELYKHILKLQKDYFTEMHLKALPYYQALALKHFGKDLEARAMIDAARKDWQKKMQVEDAGFFQTTPFFISFSTRADIARKACFSSLLGYAEDFIGNTDAAKEYFSNGNDIYGRLYK